MKRPDDRVYEIAARQCSRFAREQALDAGISDMSQSRRVKSGRWLLPWPGVYALPGHPASFVGDLWTAHLAAGPTSIVSFQAAAMLRGIPGFLSDVPILTVPHGSHARLVPAVVHQTRDPWPISHSLVNGLPVTTIERTIVDLAALGRRYRPRLRMALESVVDAKLTSDLRVGEALASVARRGKPGVALLAGLLDARGPGRAMARSALERALFGLFDTYGGPRPSQQVALPGRQAVTGLVDGCLADSMIIVEADGRRWHSRMQDMRRDRDRDNEAARAGYVTLRLLCEHIVGDPRGTWELIVETHESRLRQLGRAA